MNNSVIQILKLDLDYDTKDKKSLIVSFLEHLAPSPWAKFNDKANHYDWAKDNDENREPNMSSTQPIVSPINFEHIKPLQWNLEITRVHYPQYYVQKEIDGSEKALKDGKDKQKDINVSGLESGVVVLKPQESYANSHSHHEQKNFALMTLEVAKRLVRILLRSRIGNLV